MAGNTMTYRIVNLHVRNGGGKVASPSFVEHVYMDRAVGTVSLREALVVSFLGYMLLLNTLVSHPCNSVVYVTPYANKKPYMSLTMTSSSPSAV